MTTTAHPDDENNGLLVMLNRGQGYRTALATATRGNGGQNEIGPEIFEALGVLRTGELAALHRFDGAEQYFTRAVDFGYSFSIDETFEKWGREEIIADYVRLIRTIRPDVIIALPPTGNAGGQHHMASAVHHARGLQARRRSDEVPGADQGRPAPVAAEEVLSQRRLRLPRRAGRRAGRADARQLARSTIRCSARPTRRSAPRRAACTSARAWRSCSRCPAPTATATLSARRDDDCRRSCDGRDVAVRRHRHAASPASRSSPARRPPKELDRRPGRDRRRGPGGAEDVRHADRRSDAAAAARRPARGARAARPAARACDRRQRRSSRSISACARRRASSSRRRSRQRRPRRSARRRRRRRARTAGEGERHRRQPRRRRRRRQAGEVRRLRRRRGVRADGVHRRAGRLSRRTRRPRRRRGAGDVDRAQGSGRALRADADDSRRRARHRAVLASQGRRRAATRSTPTRRSACRSGRRRSTCR